MEHIFPRIGPEPETFRNTVQSAPGGELWEFGNGWVKMKEFGWRSHTNETCTSQPCLIGNWNEERYDVDYRKIAEPLPSQFSNNFNSIYNSTYNKMPRTEVPEVLKNEKQRHSYSYPCHQPEFDDDTMKDIYNSWATEYRARFVDPEIRRRPFIVEKDPPPPCDPPKEPRVCYVMKGHHCLTEFRG